MDATIPDLRIDDAKSKLYQPGSDRDLLRVHADEVGHQFAAYAAAEAAVALRELFGEPAHKAVFHRTDEGDAGVDATLLLVLDNDGKVIWYNRETNVFGSELAGTRDATGEPMPDIERDTLRYIEGLVELAEDTGSDGYLVMGDDIVFDPSLPAWLQPYYGTTVELIIADELPMPERVNGPPAHDGSTRPQRRALSPNARMVAVLALQRLLDKAGGMLRVPLTAEEKDLLGEVIAALDPR